MDFKLKGKKAFISASTSGIGLEAARILLNEGMTVYINGRSEKTVKKAVEYLKNEISLDEAITNASIATRQYAKRQRTWIKARMKQWDDVTELID